MEILSREQCLVAMRKDMGRFFTKASASSQAKQPKHSIEERARIKVRELLRGGEITASKAKKMLQKITIKFTPYNNENERIRY